MNNTINFKNMYEGEHTIQKLIKSDNNCSAHFEYSNITLKGIELTVITYNPSHKTSFFLHSLYGKNKIEVLEKMYKHIYELKTTLKKKESPYLNYLIEWYNPKEKEKVTSSFYGENIQQVLKKFYYGKYKENNIIIYNMKLIPSNPSC